MNQSFVELQEICRFISGGTPSTKVPEYFMGTIPWITGADMNGNVITKARQYITAEAIQNSATNIVPKGNILLVTRTGVGKVAIAGVDICISQDFTGLELDKTKVDEWYLLYYLRSQEEALTSQQRGATIQGITRDVVETLKIPLPPLDEQKRIASLLARADRLRSLRRYARRLADSLLQSVFLEMFGEPQSNLNKWDKVEIADITESLDSRRIPVEASIRQMKKGQYPYYGASGIIDYVEEYIFDEETLLVAEDGANLLARSTPIAFIANGKYWVNNHAHVLRMKNINIHFLCYLLNMMDLEPYVTGSAQPKLNASNLEKIQVIYPPLPLQEEFARVAARVEGLRARQAEAERQAEGLFQALLSESFAPTQPPPFSGGKWGRSPAQRDGGG